MAWRDAWVFECENPDVLPMLVDIARRFAVAGKRRVSFRLCWEILRGNMTLRIQGPGEFKLNDRHWMYFVERLCQVAPDVAPLLERRRRSA
jgi:hypothetical protein